MRVSSSRVGVVQRRRWRVVVAAVIGLAAGLSVPVPVSAGDGGGFDASFGGAGRVETTFRPSSQDAGRAVTTLPDGSVLSAAAAGGDFGLAQETWYGTPDSRFSTDGRVTTDFDGRDDAANTLAVTSDGTITAAGVSSGDAALARYAPDGRLVRSFGDGGRILADWGGPDDRVTGLALEADGRAVVAGTSAGAAVLERFDAAGTPDPTFGVGGVARLVLPGPVEVLALTRLADGRFVVAGGWAGNALVAAFTSDGALDLSFGQAGLAVVELGGADDTFAALTVDSGDRIVAAGSSAGDFALARLSPAGQLDTSFGDGGRAVEDYGGTETGRAVFVAASGAIIVGGDGADRLGLLAGFTPSGARDPDFGIDGAWDMRYTPNGIESITGLAPGRAGLTGAVMLVGTTQNADATVAQSGTSGGTLNSFTVTIDFGRVRQSGVAVAASPDGTVLVAGESADAPAVVRYRPDGSLDPTFGTGGRVSTDRLDGLTAMTLRLDGRAVIAGPLGWQSGLIRLSPDGTEDLTFGEEGLAAVQVTKSDVIFALAQTLDGSLIAAGGGHTDTSAGPDVWHGFVTRLLADGSPDPTFGNGGVVSDPGDAPIWSVAVDPVGRIVVAGGEWNLELRRLLPDGSPDPTFGNNGTVTADSAFRGRYAVAVQPDGHIVVGGQTNYDFTAVRFLADGTPDSTFGNNGYARFPTAVPDVYSVERAMTVTLDGSVVVAGEAGGMPTAVRFRPDGAPDTGFGAGGRLTLVTADLGSWAAAAATLDGRVLLTGRAGVHWPSNLLTARLTAATVVPVVPGIPASGSGAPGSGPGTPAVPVAPPAGYWLLGADGRIYPFGDAGRFGDAAGTMSAAGCAVDVERSPSGEGYWILDEAGTVWAYGDAIKLGALPAGWLRPAETATSLSSTPSGHGYWVFTSLGRVRAFGDAGLYGDLSGVRLNGPVLDSVSTPTGQGYFMVGSDGGVFSFGDARFAGSLGAVRVNAPVQSLVPAARGAGYWLVASDGGIFAFGDAAFRGSMGGRKLNRPVTGMVRFGDGYLMVAEDGGIFNFSDRPFSGSLGGTAIPSRIVAVAARI